MKQSKVLDSTPPTDEQSFLIKTFQEFEVNQINYLDSHSKRLIELITALLGLLFSIIAFGNDYPPQYLASPTAKILGSLSILFYLGSMLIALLALRPRNYKLYRNNLSEMRTQFDKLIKIKSSLTMWAGILFFVGSAFLTTLILNTILRA